MERSSEVRGRHSALDHWVGVSSLRQDAVTEFDVRDTDGNSHVLSQMVEAGPVILAFFPKAFTPG